MADVVNHIVRKVRTYPWAQWSDGRAWLAKKGRDFKCSPAGFRSAVYMAALRQNRAVVVTVDGDEVGFQFGKKKKPRK